MQNKKNQRTKKEIIRINRDIKANEIRLIDEKGEMIGVIKIEEGLKKADESGLDLVEISPNAKPPVCKIIDYGKYLYQIEKKKKEAKKNQKVVHLKEIKLRPKTDIHDYNFKVKHIKEFLKSGNKVKVTVKFRGREMAFMAVGKEQLDKVIADTAELGKPDSSPRLEGRNLNLTIIPKK